MSPKSVTLPQLRKLAGLSQGALAAKLGVRQPTVSELERSKDPSLSSVTRVVTALGGTLELRVRLGEQDYVLVSDEMESDEAPAKEEETPERLPIRDAIVRILGAQQLTPEEVAQRLAAKGVLPDTHDPLGYIEVTLRKNPEVFEPVEGGRYRRKSIGRFTK